MVENLPAMQETWVPCLGRKDPLEKLVCVGLYRWLVKVSWLGKLVSMFWWVELYFFSLYSWAQRVCSVWAGGGLSTREAATLASGLDL